MDGQELERTALSSVAEADNILLRGYPDEWNIAVAAANAALAQAAALLLLVETVREIAEQSGGDDEDYRAGLIETVWATYKADKADKADKAAKAARERRRRDDD